MEYVWYLNMVVIKKTEEFLFFSLIYEELWRVAQIDWSLITELYHLISKIQI